MRTIGLVVVSIAVGCGARSPIALPGDASPPSTTGGGDGSGGPIEWFALGRDFTCATSKSDPGHDLRCWGRNDRGQLGDLTSIPRSLPAPVVDDGTHLTIASGSGAQMPIVAGGAHACASRLFPTASSSYELSCWGANDRQQLGDGTRVDRLQPIAIEATRTSPSMRFGVGEEHTCAIVGEGLFCWGSNDDGRLGVGDTTDRPTPTKVLGIDAPIAVALGLFHSCAIERAGDVACWGANDAGQLGNGTHGRSLLPFLVAGTEGVVELALGSDHTCALEGGGDLLCWGSNAAGQLGVADATSLSTPTRVASGIAHVAAGAHHTCALSIDGTVKCFGADDHGQLGDGSLRDVVTIVAGADHTCALDTRNVLRCWGRNDFGQLGDGTTVDRKTPVKVRW